MCRYGNNIRCSVIRIAAPQPSPRLSRASTSFLRPYGEKGVDGTSPAMTAEKQFNMTGTCCSNPRPGVLDCPNDPPIKSGEGSDTEKIARKIARRRALFL